MEVPLTALEKEEWDRHRVSQSVSGVVWAIL